MKLIQELMTLREESEIVELTAHPTPSREQIYNAWTEKLNYRGHNVYNLIYDGPIAEEISEQMKHMSDRFDGELEMQEVYLGYSPSKDQFIQGFDGWFTLPGDENADENDPDYDDYRSNCSPFIVFSVDSDFKGCTKIESGDDISQSEGMWYSANRKYMGNNAVNGMQAAKNKFSDLIDIRLD